MFDGCWGSASSSVTASFLVSEVICFVSPGQRPLPQYSVPYGTRPQNSTAICRGLSAVL